MEDTQKKPKNHIPKKTTLIDTTTPEDKLNTGLRKNINPNSRLSAEQIEFRSMSRADRKDYLEKKRLRDRELVHGKFMFHERPGSKLKFPYLRYAGDNVEHYELLDGEYYSIPRGVARHLNENGSYVVHQYAMNSDASRSAKVGRTVRRFSFVRTEFDPTESMEHKPDLITIEHI